MTENSSATRYKVGRVLDEYELDYLAERLPELWLGENGERYSLRELADRINREVLEAAMEQQGVSPLEGEVSNYYRLLTDDQVSSGDRTQAQRVLERDGVDVEDLKNDFVTHQAVHTYLQKHHGVERESRQNDPRDTVERFRGRLQAVTKDAVDRAHRNDGGFEDVSVIVNVDVICNECGQQLKADDALAGGICDCNT